MLFIPSLSPEDAQSVVPLSVALIGFLLFWFTFHSEDLRRAFHDRMEHDQACLWHIFTAKAQARSKSARFAELHVKWREVFTNLSKVKVKKHFTTYKHWICLS